MQLSPVGYLHLVYGTSCVRSLVWQTSDVQANCMNHCGVYCLSNAILIPPLMYRGAKFLVVVATYNF